MKKKNFFFVKILYYSIIFAPTFFNFFVLFRYSFFRAIMYTSFGSITRGNDFPGYSRSIRPMHCMRLSAGLVNTSVSSLGISRPSLAISYVAKMILHSFDEYSRPTLVSRPVKNPIFDSLSRSKRPTLVASASFSK